MFDLESRFPTLRGDVDPRPWAAYVIGRGPHMIELRHDECLAALRLGSAWDDFEEEDGSAPRSVLNAEALAEVFDEIALVDEAVWALAAKGNVNPVALHNYHVSMREYLRTLDWISHFELTRARREDFDEEQSDSLVWDIEQYAGSLLRGDEALVSWRELGHRVGGYLQIWWDNRDLTPSVRNDSYGRILEMLQKLTAATGYTFLRELLSQVTEDFSRVWPSPPTVSSPLAHFEQRWADISRLDEGILAGVGGTPRSEPWLVLDRDRPTLFGRSIPVAGNHKEIACLWTLAESVGHSVDRSTIKVAVETGRDLDDIKFLVSRLRKLLRPIIDEYYQATGRPRHRYAHRCFIVADRGPKGGEPGAYTLKLEASRVRVGRVRPTWM